MKISDIPFGKFRDKGVPLDNISQYDSGTERIVLISSQSELNLYRLVFVTAQAMCKVVDGGEFDVSKRTVASTKLSEGDEVISVSAIKEQTGIVLRTAQGYFLRFDLSEIPEKKKAAIGVRGMKLGKDDAVEEVYYMQSQVPGSITYKEHEIELNKLRLGKRDTKGVKVRLS